MDCFFLTENLFNQYYYYFNGLDTFNLENKFSSILNFFEILSQSIERL